MALLTLGLGSNLQPEYHISLALDALYARFGEMELSSVFESEAVGFQGGNFLNMVVATHTDLPLDDISLLLKELENRSGRQRDQHRFSPRTLDIDILTLGDLQGEHHGIVLPDRKSPSTRMCCGQCRKCVPSELIRTRDTLTGYCGRVTTAHNKSFGPSTLPGMVVGSRFQEHMWADHNHNSGQTGQQTCPRIKQ